MCAYRLGPPIPAVEAPRVVQYDCPCARCSYNLRGLLPSGVCPECAAPIAVSLEGRLLRHASRDFLRSVDFGLTVLLCALWLYVAMFAASVVAALLIKAQQSKEVAEAVSRAMMLLPTLAFVVGYWKFTTPDAGDADTGRAFCTRNIIRVAVFVQLGAKLSALAVVLAIHAATSVATTPGYVSPLEPLATALNWLDIAAWITVFYAVLVHVRALADRVPNVEIRARAKGFMWFIPMIFIIGFYFFGIGPIASLILYATLLQSLQQHFKETLDWQERGGRFTFN
jgi:hypothetical protein